MHHHNSTALCGSPPISASIQRPIWFHGRGPSTSYRVPVPVFACLIHAGSAGPFCHLREALRELAGPEEAVTKPLPS